LVGSTCPNINVKFLLYMAEEEPVEVPVDAPVEEVPAEEVLAEVMPEEPLKPERDGEAGSAFKERSKKREIEQCFFLNDFNGSGRIPNDKIINLIRQLGANSTESEIPQIYNKIDPENTGEFNLENFAAFMKTKLHASSSKEELQDAFDLFDRNGDGVLTLDD